MRANLYEQNALEDIDVDEKRTKREIDTLPGTPGKAKRRKKRKAQRIARRKNRK